MTERQKYHYTEIITQVSITGRKVAQFQKANYKLYIEFKCSQLITSMFSPTIVTQPHKKLPASYGILELLTTACQCTIFHTRSFKVHILPSVFLNTHFNTAFQTTLRSSRYPSFLIYLTKILYLFIITPMCTACLTHLIPLDINTL